MNEKSGAVGALSLMHSIHHSEPKNFKQLWTPLSSAGHFQQAPDALDTNKRETFAP